MTDWRLPDQTPYSAVDIRTLTLKTTNREMAEGETTLAVGVKGGTLLHLPVFLALTEGIYLLLLWFCRLHTMSGLWFPHFRGLQYAPTAIASVITFDGRQ